MIAPMQVSVGKPVTFSGYAEDYGKQIVSVQLSLIHISEPTRH